MLNSLQNDRCSFIFRTLFVQITSSIISRQKSSPLLQSILTSLFHPYFSQIHPHNRHWHFFFYTSLIFNLAIFKYHHPNNLQQKYFPHQGARELGSLVRTNTVLNCLFLLKVWTAISDNSDITDSLLLRFRKLVYCR